ncbi:MAG TPA: efflux RND transporter periplasmic adaptor subunit, partial [Thermodesulfatator sp.]|nr:efflux RND transporter periplasmic adaptor subunit [Thermodesulfatator sp.]
MRGKSILITWISFIVLVIIAACSGSKEEGTATLKGREISAETYTVKAKTVPIFRSFPGTVEAKAEIVLSSKVSGYVTKVAVKEGDRVTPGTILLTIDDRQIRQQIAALKEAREAILKERQAILARLNYAKSNFERFKRLFKEEAATKEELERAQAEYLALKRQAQALERKERETVSRIKATESLLPYTQIKSPTEALVARRLVDQGSFVNVGQPLIYLDDLKAGFWLVAEIDESLLPFVSPDKEVVVTIPSLNKNLKAPVEVVVDHVSPQTRTFRIKVNLPIPIQAGL